MTDDDEVLMLAAVDTIRLLRAEIKQLKDAQAKTFRELRLYIDAENRVRDLCSEGNPLHPTEVLAALNGETDD
jgi:FtsZ-binding cell division protein ZapB